MFSLSQRRGRVPPGLCVCHKYNNNHNNTHSLYYNYIVFLYSFHFISFERRKKLVLLCVRRSFSFRSQFDRRLCVHVFYRMIANYRPFVCEWSGNDVLIWRKRSREISCNKSYITSTLFSIVIFNQKIDWLIMPYFPWNDRNSFICIKDLKGKGSESFWQKAWNSPGKQVYTDKTLQKPFGSSFRFCQTPSKYTSIYIKWRHWRHKVR